MNKDVIRYAAILSNIVSGYRWVHFPKTILKKETIAVYIYIIYNIIRCTHCTHCTHHNYIHVCMFFTFCSIPSKLVGTGGNWVQNAYCYCLLFLDRWVHSGYKVVTNGRFQ